MTEVAFVYVANKNRYYAYVDGVQVGYIFMGYDSWMFFTERSTGNIFPPPQADEIKRAGAARAALLNLTERLLK